MDSNRAMVKYENKLNEKSGKTDQSKRTSNKNESGQ
jgi:hypothetical protein